MSYFIYTHSKHLLQNSQTSADQAPLFLQTVQTVQTVSPEEHRRELAIQWIMHKMVTNDILTDGYLRSLPELESFSSNEQTELIDQAKTRLSTQVRKVDEFLSWYVI